jgi:exonuclease SbcC
LAQLHKSRDSVVSLGAPPVEDADQAAAWQTPITWVRAQYTDRTQRQPELDGNAATLQQRVRGDMEAITGLLAEHDITDPTHAAAAVAAQTVRAENELKAVRQTRKKAAKLDEQIRNRNEEEQVATMLVQLLRAGSF